MNEDIQLVLDWIEALESGRYPQVIGHLRTLKGFCCLGVLCDIVNPNLWELDGEYHDYYAYKIDDDTRNDYFALAYLPVHIKERIPFLPGYVEDELVEMNDEGKSFIEIATYLRQKLDNYLKKEQIQV